MSTKLLRALSTVQAKFRKKSQRFEDTFVASTFFLFFGFMCGNLFGTFLSFFRQTIPWDGAIIALILLFVEWINYLHFVILHKRTSIPSSPEPKPKNFGWMHRLTHSRWLWMRLETKTVRFQPWPRFVKPAFVFCQRQRNVAIRLLNFYKLGLLLGFFIDAFKVGS